MHVDHRTVTPPLEIRDYALGLVHRLGPRQAAEILGVSRLTLLSLAAGVPVMPGSVALAREAMRARGVL